MSKRALTALILMFLMLGLIAFQPAAANSGDDWTMFHHDPAHTGASSANAILVPNLIWKSNVSILVPESLAGNVLSIDTEFSSPAIVNNVVYVCSGTLINSLSGYGGAASWGDVYAFNATSGAEVWNYRIATDGFAKSSPCVVNNVVFFGFDNVIGAINASNGVSIWNYTAGAYESSPTVVDNVVYVGSSNDVLALNAANGNKIWNETIVGAATSSPTVVKGTVYTGSLDGVIYALNASNGNQLWTYSPVGSGEGFLGSPAFAKNVLYVGSMDDSVYALNSSSGEQIWNFTTYSSVRTSPAVANNVVYVSSDDGNVYALNASNGIKLWNNTLSAPTLGGSLSSPVIADAVVYVGANDGNLYALNATEGSKLWSFQTYSSYPGGSFVRSPGIANGALYLTSNYYSSNNTFLYALGTLSSSPIPSSSQTTTPSPSVSSSSIPEFPSWTILPLLIVSLSIAGVYLRRKPKTR